MNVNRTMLVMLGIIGLCMSGQVLAFECEFTSPDNNSPKDVSDGAIYWYQPAFGLY